MNAPEMAKKQCERCAEEKRIAEFPPALDDEGYFTRDGHSVCCACHADWSRAARQGCREATEAERAALHS
jgi:hypothetical protein